MSRRLSARGPLGNARHPSYVNRDNLIGIISNQVPEHINDTLRDFRDKWDRKERLPIGVEEQKEKVVLEIRNSEKRSQSPPRVLPRWRSRLFEPQ